MPAQSREIVDNQHKNSMIEKIKFTASVYDVHNVSDSTDEVTELNYEQLKRKSQDFTQAFIIKLPYPFHDEDRYTAFQIRKVTDDAVTFGIKYYNDSGFGADITLSKGESVCYTDMLFTYDINADYFIKLV